METDEPTSGGSSGGAAHNEGAPPLETSKLDPAVRNQGIGFRIGDAFPADDPIARWATVLAMAANDAIYLNIRLIEGDLPPALNVYYFRLIVAHFYEIALWLKRTRATWPQVEALIGSLTLEHRERYERIVAFTHPSHPLHGTLSRSRHTLFHYPTMHPGRDAAGDEELANAMREAAELPGWIEAGEDYGSFRAAFADEVAVQFLGEEEDAGRLMEDLNGPVFELVELTEAVLLAHLESLPPEATVQWRRGDPRPQMLAGDDDTGGAAGDRTADA